jgi:chromosome segregation ATPase
MMKALIYNQTALMQSTNKFIHSTKKFMQRIDQAIQSNNRDIQELKSSVARIEGQISHLVTESNKIEEEEFQSQLMIERHYMNDRDEVVDNKEEQVEHNERIEHHEKSQPPTDPNLLSDIEVSTKAPACITAPLKTHQEPKASSLECLKEPSYVKILEDLSTQAQKSRNHIPKKILRSKQFYIRCQNILP